MSADVTFEHVIAAMAVIISVSYAVGLLFRQIHQPEVIGQLLAGIVLGPSVLGRYGGPVFPAIFPHSILSYLNVTSQIALILFLFAVGYELDLGILRQQRGRVPAIAAAAFFAPAILGAVSVLGPTGNLFQGVGEPHAHTAAFVLFMAVAVSITAVPVLASIVRERGISHSIAGVTALASAALIDVLGWTMLTGVFFLASTSSPSHRSWLITVGWLIFYFAASVFIVRPLLRKFLVAGIWRRSVRSSMASYVSIAAALALGSAWVTAVLGLHVIIGAMFAGVIMPRRSDGTPDPGLSHAVFQAGGLLLPVFFMVAGLSVNITTLSWPDLWLLGVVLLIAFVGKFGVGSLASRLAGLQPKDSWAVGAMLNTRGLTELIALNAGLTAGLIHQRLYTILVLMAVVTTVFTGPALSLLERCRMFQVETAEPPAEPCVQLPAE